MVKENKNQKGLTAQAGVSLIITFFVMLIILAIVISISALLYSEVKVIRNIGNSIVSFYAADSGVEKVLFYDRQVLPLSSDRENLVKRGLCSMFKTESSKSCQPNENERGPRASIYCNKIKSENSLGGACDPDICDDCIVEFETVFSGKTYNVVATLTSGSVYSNLKINSKGLFSGAERKIEANVQTSVSADMPPTLTGYHVSGAGTDVANGDYVESGTNDGQPAYEKVGGGAWLFWNSRWEAWYIYESKSSFDWYKCPTITGTWATDIAFGEDPAPTVTRVQH